MNNIVADGYVFVDKAFNVDNLYKDIDRVFRIYTRSELSFDEMLKDLFSKDLEGFIGCSNCCQYLPSLYSICVSERMMQLLNDLGIKVPSLNTRPLLSFSSRFTSINQSYWKLSEHQDWVSMQGSLNSLTCWVPLIDVDQSLGPLEILPKSHRLGLIEHLDVGGVPPFIEKQNKPDGDYVSFVMDAGDALFFNPFTVHRSGNNKSDKIRVSAHFRYDDCCEESFIERKYPRHRIERRKEGLLFENFPTIQQLNNFLDHFK